MRRDAVYKLGRTGPGIDPLKRTLDMGQFMKPYYIDPALDNRAGILAGFSDFGNTGAGDCTCATFAQARMFLSAMSSRSNMAVVTSGTPIVTPTPEVIAWYRQVTKNEGAEYDPATGQNDNGCDFLDVCKFQRKVGFIGAFGTVGASRLKDAIWLFGGVCLGLSLPDDWRDQMESGVWDILDAEPNRNNGHEVYCMGYERDGSVIVSTWGQYMKLTPKALDGIVDDRMVIVSPDWLKDGVAPSQFNQTDLLAAVKRVAA
jgi:hypothetical protein